ncbi:hypothetical protein ANCDUO_23388, partial [Ancylostoma duodenale]
MNLNKATGWRAPPSPLRSYRNLTEDMQRVQQLKSLIPKSTVVFYKQPLLITKGEMQYLYDSDGKKYLDMFAGIVTVSVGHCHP